MMHYQRARSYAVLTAAIVTLGLFSATVVHAASGKQPAPKKQMHHPGAKKRFRARNTHRAHYSPRLIITTQHQWAHFQKEIKSKMKLTKEQIKRIDKVFADLNEELLTGRTPGPSNVPGGGGGRAVRVPLPKTLHGAADVVRLKRRMAAAERASAGGPPVSPFASRRVVVERLAPEFHGLQQNEFMKIAARWNVLEPRVGLRDGPLMRLRRSALDPALKLNGSELEDVQNLIGARMKDFGANRFDESKTNAAADELRAKILEMLTPQQQAMLVATNRALDKDAELLEKKILEAETQASIPEAKDEQ